MIYDDSKSVIAEPISGAIAFPDTIVQGSRIYQIEVAIISVYFKEYGSTN